MGVLRQQLKQTVVFLMKFFCLIVAQVLKPMTMVSMMVVRIRLPHTSSCCRPVSSHIARESRSILLLIPPLR